MTLEELIDLQYAWGLTNVHIVDIGPKDFRLAHTDVERAAGSNGRPCPIHEWLADRAGPPAPAGIYVVTEHEVDAYSEHYGAEPWELHRLKPIT